jgi:hypothetical protein
VDLSPWLWVLQLKILLLKTSILYRFNVSFCSFFLFGVIGLYFICMVCLIWIWKWHILSVWDGNLKILIVSYSLQKICMLCPKWVDGLNYIEIMKLQRTKQTKVNKLKIMDEILGTTNLNTIYWILVCKKVFLFPK